MTYLSHREGAECVYTNTPPPPVRHKLYPHGVRTVPHTEGRAYPDTLSTCMHACMGLQVLRSHPDKNPSPQPLQLIGPDGQQLQSAADAFQQVGEPC
jgi:hypothetical protein